jgi:hypothetical protein
MKNLNSLIDLMSSRDKDNHDLLRTYVSTLNNNQRILIKKQVFDLITKGGYPFVISDLNFIKDYWSAFYYFFDKTIFCYITANDSPYGYYFDSEAQHFSNTDIIRFSDKSTESEFTERFINDLKELIENEFR